MLKEFISLLTIEECVILSYIIMYAVIHGIKYHCIVIYATLSGRGYTTDILTTSLNWAWYLCIAYVLYNWV